MADAVDDFFEQLAERGDEPLLRMSTGSVRFDVVSGSDADEADIDRWLVTFDRGAMSVRHGGGNADCTVAADRRLLGEIVEGRTNAMAALLRGELTCAGEIELIFAVQRLFPGPLDVRSSSAGGGRHG